MALTRLIGANALSGNIPAANFNNASLNSVTAIPSSIATGEMKLISTATASASDSIEFTLGDYKEYEFYFYNIHPSAPSNVTFGFNLSTDSGSNYNVTKTSTVFHSRHDEGDGDTALTYDTGKDLAQSTSDQSLISEVTFPIAVNADEHYSGNLKLFNPSSSTYVKHFISTGFHYSSTYGVNDFVAGYGNTTSPINSIIFRFSAGNIDDGSILMFGIN